jgi:hypothetical protein
MTPAGRLILEHLQAVKTERERCASIPSLGARVDAIKSYQHARFARTYIDLLDSPRFGPATQFFLNDVYGPRDFSERDAQFARIVPAIVRLFPDEIVTTVSALAELHALSEAFDVRMAQAMRSPDIDAASYLVAWQTVADGTNRERQLSLMLGVGRLLDRLTRSLTLRHSLRLMSAPARAAGLGDLQHFLERGFDTFRSMQGADEFLETIATGERRLMEALYDPRTNADAAAALLPEAGVAHARSTAGRR